MMYVETRHGLRRRQTCPVTARYFGVDWGRKAVAPSPDVVSACVVETLARVVGSSGSEHEPRMYKVPLDSTRASVVRLLQPAQLSLALAQRGTADSHSWDSYENHHPTCDSQASSSEV